MMTSKAQIIATIGPASASREILFAMAQHGMDIVRFNFSWSDIATRTEQVALIRSVADEVGRTIPIIADLPGPRVQIGDTHTYKHDAESCITEEDKKFIRFAVEHKLEWVALSFVSTAENIICAREIIHEYGGTQKIIAKIERKQALDTIDSIIAVADGVMAARGDLGNEIPLEEIPFVQRTIIEKCKQAGKPVITATEMLLSMTEKDTPTRAELTDVSQAILEGSDAVMLSEETARGKFPVESVTMMERLVLEAEKHMEGKLHINKF